jgi:hypothetical protein
MAKAHDCTIPLLDGGVVCLEIKRCELEEHGPWRQQAVSSSTRIAGGVPVVVWRRWRVRVPLGWLLVEP